MPQAAWEALLRGGFQGLHPPYTPLTLDRWLQTTHPQALSIGAPQPPPPPHLHQSGKRKGTGRRRATNGKGLPGKGARRGPR